MADWTPRPGDILRRAQLHGTYGGSKQSGIAPSSTTPNVLVYSDRFEGAKYGYVYDGWSASEQGVFYYSGDGQIGDQSPDLRGNKAILEHHTSGKALRLFATLDQSTPPGGKRQRYLGEFEVDVEHPYELKPGIDRDGNQRNVVVFRLLAIEAQEPSSEAGTSELNFGRTRRRTSPQAERPEAGAAEKDLQEALHSSTVTMVDPELHQVFETTHPPRAGAHVVKAEARLVSSWEHHLRTQGSIIRRARIAIESEKGELVTDTLDETTQILYEAKSSADRSTVRLAIGQLVDYLRFLPGYQGAVLVDAEPTADVQALVAHSGFDLVFRKLGGWHTRPSSGPEQKSDSKASASTRQTD